MTKTEENRLNSLTDEEIVEALLRHDSTVSNWFFYKKSYPLFKATFEKYQASFVQHGVMIENVVELTNSIYAHIMIPGKENKMCALSSFAFSCSLFSWLKIVTKNYCLQLIGHKPVFTSLEITNSDGDNFIPNEPSIDIDGYSMALDDVIRVINEVSLPRYREILYMHHIDNVSREEAASKLGITIAAYDNALSRANKEFKELKEIHLK